MTGDEHTFSVTLIRGVVQVRCQMCGWRTSYPYGDDEKRKEVKAAAIEHREGQLKWTRS